jgi:hypothetical protein
MHLLSNSELLPSKDEPSNKGGCTLHTTIQGCNLQATFKRRSNNFQTTEKRMRFLSNSELLPSKVATFKQLSNNRQEDAIFKQQRTASIQGCNSQTTFRQPSQNYQRTKKRMHFLSNSELLPSKDATFKQTSSDREEEAIFFKHQKTIAIQRCTLQTRLGRKQQPKSSGKSLDNN